MEKIMKHKAVSAASLAAIALALGGFCWAYFGLQAAAGGSPLVIHFDDMNGITKIGNLWDIATIGILGVIITVMNFFIATELEEHDRFLGKITAAASVLFAVLLFIAFAAILSIN